MTRYTSQAFVQTRLLKYRSLRIRATNVTSGRTVTIPWNDRLGCAENHMAAATACLEACGQDLPAAFIACGTKDSSGYVFTGAL